MVSVWWLLLALLLHVIADFWGQTNWMALNKSKNNLALLAHAGIIFAVFLPIGYEIAFLNALAHFIIDYVTSRMTHRLWNNPRTSLWYNVPGTGNRLFWNVIGTDQFLHMVVLVLLLTWLK
jgi:membrane-bound metal-dependent hydrolase YbcI (DUF457 family)